MSVKVNSFEIENVKRVKGVVVEKMPDNLVVVGGRNKQGKTSVLDAICWALGGDRYKPSQAKREGAIADPYIKITLSNGIIVERKGKNSSLKVTDPLGGCAGQQLLNEFIHQFALDLPRFLSANTKEKANFLLQIIGVGDELRRLETEENRIYNERHAFGQIADQKRKFATEMSSYPDVPEAPISASELIQQQQNILAKNGENQAKRQRLESLSLKLDSISAEVESIQRALTEAIKKKEQTLSDLEVARKSAKDLQDESTAQIEESITRIDETNIKVRANLDKQKALNDAEEHANKYEALSTELNKVRSQKIALLDNANLPLPDLGIQDSELTYKGQKWDNISASEQLIIATAVTRKLNPNCGFVLMDKLEQMDDETLTGFAKWLEAEDLQVIGTRVSTGDECSIIIEDGQLAQEPATNHKPKFAPGVF